MKLTKFGTLVNKTTYLFTSIRDSNYYFQGVCENYIANPFRGGGMDIFWKHTIGRRDVDLHGQLWVVQGQMG